MTPPQPNVDPFGVGHSADVDPTTAESDALSFLSAAQVEPFDWSQFDLTGTEPAYLENELLLHGTAMDQDHIFDQTRVARGPSTGPGSFASVHHGTDGHQPAQPTKLIHKRPPRPPKPPPPGSTLADRSCAKCRERKGELDPAGPRSPSSRAMAGQGQGRAELIECLTDATVKCDRVVPVCRHCKARRDECDLVDWRPKPPKLVAHPHCPARHRCWSLANRKLTCRSHFV